MSCITYCKMQQIAGDYLLSVYSWIADQRDAHKKSFCRQTRGIMTIPRPPLESSWWEEFRSTVTIFVKSIVGVLTFWNM